QVPQEKGLESAAFFNAEWSVSPAFQFSAGLRFNLYNYFGPQTEFVYASGAPFNRLDIVDTLRFDKGEVIETYNSLEPRLSMRYRLNPESSVKAGYSRTSQFINQIFNTDTPTPISRWQLSTLYIEPQRAHNFSLGYFRNFENNLWETSAEVYYRVMDEMFDFKDFAELNVNEHLETELLRGEGRAYGLELSVKKKEGTFNGWVSYTYSRAERQIPGINQGDWYPSNFDKPHDASLILNYQPNQRNTITLSFNFSSGRPTTPPIGNYQDPSGLIVPVYSDRNQVRIPDYHRLDLAYTLGQGYNRTKKFKTSWTISIYNVYSRENAFSVFFTQGPFRLVQANQLSILGSAFPSLTFNLELI
ncbi:MAG: TonB-dependent receptor, partial [Saprospiraceae bacterium]|nr:TonB-dependent receptor [Saprospiraceae bacterium]